MIAGLGRMGLALAIYIGFPLLLIWWLGTDPIEGFILSFDELFMPSLLIFGCFFALFAFFQGYYPSNSRANSIAGFLSAGLAVIFFLLIVGTAFTGTYGTIIYEYSGTRIIIEVYWWYIIVGLLLIITALINFIRIFMQKNSFTKK